MLRQICSMNAAAIRNWWLAKAGGTPAERRQIGGRETSEPATGAGGFWSEFKRHREEAVKKAERGVKPLSILVPTDFRDESLVAMDCALRMAAHQESRITLLHAIHLSLFPYGPANVDALKTELCREALAKAEPILMAARDMGTTAVCMLEEGSPAEVILGATRRCAPDMVIMATRNPQRGFMKRWFGRGTVERVIRMARCPVLALPLTARS
jgi:nucleotide-binding universal stress UspA family protein